MSEEVEIGDKFLKRIGKNHMIECYVYDIYKIYSVKSNKYVGVSFMAKSESYGMGQPFEVAKNTIIKNPVK